MKLPSFVTKAAFEVGKHSPVILVTVGVVGVVASTVAACAASRNVDDIIDSYKEDIEILDKIEEYPDPQNKETMIKVDDKERKKLKMGRRFKMVLEFIKLYGIPAAGMAVSIACIIGAHVILRKRNAVLTAALASTTKAFEEYRKRVSGRFGDEIERQIRYNMEPNGEPVTVVDVDENGKAHKSKIQNYAIDMTKITPDDNLIYFVKGCSELWRDSDTFNEHTIDMSIEYLKEEFERERFIFRNKIAEVFKADGTVGGQALGYSYKDGDSIDIRYSAQDFIDPITNGILHGYVIELNGIHNILDKAFEPAKKELVAF